MSKAAGTDLFAPPVAVVRVASPSPERAETAKTPAIAVQPALLDGLVQDQDLAAQADLLDGVGPVAGDAAHARCLAALGDDLGELGVACDIGDVEAENVRGPLAAPQLQVDGAVGERMVEVGGRVFDLAREQPELARLERALGGIRAWHGADAVHVVSGGVERADHEWGLALDGLGRALAGQQALVRLVDALRGVHAVRDVHGHGVEAALVGVHGRRVDAEASIGLGRLGVDVLGLGKGLALILGLSGNRHGLNGVDGAERWLGLERVEALGRDGGAVD